MSHSVLTTLIRGNDLTFAEARKLFLSIFCMERSEEEIKTLLLLLAEKGESVNEIAACISALEALEPKLKCSTKGLIDTCGTGGDGSSTINVSTLAALVIAGAGGKVAKHGNRSISSKCGSSDLMEALGVNLSTTPSKMIKSITKNGIGYFHAPFYHPVFSRVQPLRKRLGVRTIFNFLGPMVNPLKLSFQLVGVANPKVMPVYAEILKKKRLKRAWVCHSRDGLDEIAISSTTTVKDVTPKKIATKTIVPQRLGLKKSPLSAVKGGTLKKNKAFALSFLKGKQNNAMSKMVLLNAAAGLTVCGIASNLHQGLALASESVKKGKAFQCLQGLRNISHS